MHILDSIAPSDPQHRTLEDAEAKGVHGLILMALGGVLLWLRVSRALSHKS